jgi:hypothetical protein
MLPVSHDGGIHLPHSASSSPTIMTFHKTQRRRQLSGNGGTATARRPAFKILKINTSRPKKSAAGGHEMSPEGRNFAAHQVTRIPTCPLADSVRCDLPHKPLRLAISRRQLILGKQEAAIVGFSGRAYRAIGAPFFLHHYRRPLPLAPRHRAAARRRSAVLLLSHPGAPPLFRRIPYILGIKGAATLSHSTHLH